MARISASPDLFTYVAFPGGVLSTGADKSRAEDDLIVLLLLLLLLR